jgi:CrcB protein
MVKSVITVGLGGFIGTVARFLISRYFQVHVNSVFPWGTFIVNIAGSLLIGFILGLSEKGELFTPETRLFLTVGICGGFTTFSTFSNDALMLAKEQDWMRFVVYSSLSFFLGLFAVYSGRIIAKTI